MAKGRKPPVKEFPFSRVRVLDNRYDRSRIYSAINTSYSQSYITLDRPAANAVSIYIDSVTASARKGNKTLLINIRTMGVPNRSSIPVSPHGSGINKGRYLRNTIVLGADAWYTTNDRFYKKILSLTIDATHYNEPLTRSLTGLLDILIRSVSRIDASSASILRKHQEITRRGIIVYAQDSTPATIEQIDIPATSRWTSHPPIKDSTVRDGLFSYFSDFLQNRPGPDTFRLEESRLDSVYQLKKSGRGQPYAVRSNGDIFILIYHDLYVKVYEEDGLLRFHVPRALPDMYAYICLDLMENQQSDNSSFHSGNFFVDMGFSILQDALAKKQDVRLVPSTEYDTGETFRRCTIDMDTGDFYFSDSRPPEGAMPIPWGFILTPWPF